MRPARVFTMLLLVLAGALAGCAPKTLAPTVPGEPRYPEFVFPAVSASPTPGVLQQHETAWHQLQAGDVRGAERAFASIAKSSAQFYPAEAGLGYVSLAKRDFKGALAHFDRALGVGGAYAPAYAGRGHAYLALDQRGSALASFDAALAADPTLLSVRAAADVLRFQGLQGGVGAARLAAQAGRLAEAQAAYEQAIAASPQSPFLYRELSDVERRQGLLGPALAHATRATELEPGDARNFMVLAEVLEAQGQFGRAAEALANAVAIDSSDTLTGRIEALRAKAAFTSMPDEYRAIDQASTVTRAQLAALIGVGLDRLIQRAPNRQAVLTDVRTSWAAPWILAVTRAGVMEAYPNHTFQPDGGLSRGGLAVAVSRVLNLIAVENPRLGARWRDARRKFGDLSPGHLSYPAASVAVEAGVMTLGEKGNFELTRPVSGIEAIAAIRKLQELATPR
ncbi:MAG: tetratricopeptide repeat protein [Vicinamibacterales bacterium]